MEKFFWILIDVTVLALIACSDRIASVSDDTFDSIPEEISARTVYTQEKYAYTIDEEKAKISVYAPVCKEQGDSLYWSSKGGEMIGFYKYSSSSKEVKFSYKGKKRKLHFDGNVFPMGDWKDSLGGFSLNSEAFTSANFFEDSCTANNLVSVGFFNGLFDAGDVSSESTCNDVKLANGTQIVVNSYSESEVDLTMSNGADRCEVKVVPRYAMNKSDCEAAYAEYKNSHVKGEKFNFANYSTEIIADANCMSALFSSKN